MTAKSNRTICLITGANQGLGFEAAKALAQTTGPNGNPYHVYIGCRNLSKGQTAAAEIQRLGIQGSVSPILLDVIKEESVIAAAAQVKKEHGHLDVLVNNAGMMSQAATVTDRLRPTLEANVLGAALVTEIFLPLLLSEATIDPRLIFVGSSMGSLAGASDTSSRYYKSVLGTSPIEYRVSKAALNMLMVEYWKKYGLHEGGKLRVWTADPGPNATNFMGNAEKAKEMGIQGPEVGAKQLTACVLGERDGQEGKMWGVYGISPW